MRKPHQYFGTEQRLRKLLQASWVKIAFSRHAQDEMKADGLDRLDVLRVLKAGKIVREEMIGMQWRNTVEGTSVDGTMIAVVVVMREKEYRIDVVTCWKLC